MCIAFASLMFLPETTVKTPLMRSRLIPKKNPPNQAGIKTTHSGKSTRECSYRCLKKKGLNKDLPLSPISLGKVKCLWNAFEFTENRVTNQYNSKEFT